MPREVAARRALAYLRGDAPLMTRLSDSGRRDVDRMRRRLLDWHLAGGISALGVGHKVVQGGLTDDLCLRVYVTRKRSNRSISTRHRIPRELRLPILDKPVTLDVIPTGHFRLNALTDPHSVMVPGLSVGHCASGETGTLGAVLTDPAGRPVIVSCAHVIAASGLATKGDAIIQPGNVNGGRCPLNTVAELADWVPLRGGADHPNTADLAFAVLKAGRGHDTGTPPIARIGARKDVQLKTGFVRRIGAMSHQSLTRIEDMDALVVLPYPTAQGFMQMLGFRGMLLYRTSSLDGDSGGPLISASGALLGFHQGTDGQGWGVGTPAWAMPGSWGLRVA